MATLAFPRPQFGIFSPKEFGVLTLLCKGLTIKEISNDSERSVKTIETHRTNIDRKISKELGKAPGGMNGVLRFIFAIEHGYVKAPQLKGKNERGSVSLPDLQATSDRAAVVS